MTEVTPAEQTLNTTELQQTADSVGETVTEISEAVERIVERIVANPIEAIQGISEEDKKRLAEQQIEMCGLLERAITTLVAVDTQFTSIATQVEGWLKAHNNLVTHLNSTILNREYFLSAIDGRIKDIEKMRITEHKTVILKNKLSFGGLFKTQEEANLQPGQYITYIAYPTEAEVGKFSIDEIERLSYNVVKVMDETGQLVTVNRNEQPELFAAVSLKFSEDFTTAASNGTVEPVNIKDKDGKDYTMLKHCGVYEFQDTSVNDANWDKPH